MVMEKEMAGETNHTYYRCLEHLKNRSLTLNLYRWESTCRLDKKFKTEIEWQIVNLPNRSAPISRPNLHLYISFDACSYGWGYVFQSITANWNFSAAELPLSINTKETLAIWYGYMSFREYLKNRNVYLLSNNTTAICYVKSMGGMTLELHSNIVKDLWNTVVKNNT